MRAVIVVAALCLLSPHRALAQISIDQVMTAQEYRDAGIDRLTDSQRIALNRWLIRYTAQLTQPNQATVPVISPPTSYAAAGGGHWIRERSSGGRLVTLEDGSVWEISSMDRIYTTLWLATSRITVLEATEGVGAYKYWLINTDDGEKALAKFLGR